MSIEDEIYEELWVKHKNDDANSVIAAYVRAKLRELGEEIKNSYAEKTFRSPEGNRMMGIDEFDEDDIEVATERMCGKEAK